jgi:hypothetical protein
VGHPASEDHHGGERAGHGDDHDDEFAGRHPAERRGRDAVPVQRATDTRIITATTAAIGISATTRPC